MNFTGGRWRWLIVLGVVGLGLALRLYIREQAAADYDEDNYLSAAASFRAVIDKGDWSEIPNVTNNQEHPPLGKLLFSFSLSESDLDQIPPAEALYPGSRLPLPHQSLQNTRFNPSPLAP